MSLTQVSGNMIAANTVFNSISANNGLYSVGNFTGTYTSGAVLDYASGLGRLSVGSSNGLAFYNGGVANTELMRIDSSGNMGIGTSSPNRRLTLQVPDNGGMDFVQGSANQTAYIFWKDSDGTDSGKISYDHGTDAMRFATNGNERLRLDASGNLGIGTTSPTYKLTVAGYSNVASANKLAIGGTADYQALLYMESATETFTIENTSDYAASAIILKTNNSERARIDSFGNLLVGTTNSSATTGAGIKINPNGDGTNLARFLIVSPATTNSENTPIALYSTGASAYRFYVGMGGTISATSTTISAISDQRLKENIRDLDDGLSTILALKPRKFDWKEGKGKDIKDDRGFIAQEFEQVFPDLIDTWKDPAPEGEEPYKSVRPDLIPVMVKAIQELSAELNELKAKINQ